jgi:hypothetical protein
MIVVAMMISTSAMAEWTEIKGNNQVRLYIDFATIHIKGTRVKVWGLLDYTTIHTDKELSYLSTKGQYEYDCSQEQSAGRAFVFYSGNMGEGEVVSSNDNPDQRFKPVVPDTIGDDLLKAVCGRLN